MLKHFAIPFNRSFQVVKWFLCFSKYALWEYCAWMLVR